MTIIPIKRNPYLISKHLANTDSTCIIPDLSTKPSKQTPIADLCMSNQTDVSSVLCVCWQCEQCERPVWLFEQKGAVNVLKDMPAIQTDSSPSIIHPPRFQATYIIVF